MKFPWFKRIGIIFIPASAAGWLILIIGLAYSAYTFMEIDSHSHSVSDTLMNFTFRLFLIYIAYALIALLTVRTRSEE